jgi:tetratricopeptide (TPR) repeat protein
MLVLGVIGLAGLAVGLHYWPETHLRKARAALERRDYDSARTLLERYLSSRPDSGEAHLLLAQLDRRAGKYDGADSHLKAARRLGFPADAVELERGLLEVQNGVYNSELDALMSKHLARQDANQYMILEALSQGLTKTYRLREALACLDQMLVLQPDSAYALRRRAWIYEQGERHDLALADYRHALEIDPDDSVARLGLAQILLGVRKENREAAEHFDRLWAIRKDSTVLLGLAQSLRRVGKTDEARKLLDDWLAAHPSDAQALTERGQMALEEQASDLALDLLQRAVKIAPTLPDANYALSLCMTRLGRTAEAKECLARMEQGKQEGKQVKEELGQLVRQLQATPDDADLRCRIAQIFLKGGEEEGLRWLLVNVQNHPGHRPSHRALADYYERQGNTVLAAEQRRLAGASD